MNKVILMGRMTKDPEMRVTPSGTQVTNFTLAVDRQFKDQNGNKQTDFINCIAFKHTAEFISKYFVKGQLTAVVGTIQTRNYDDKDGKKVYVTEVIVNEAYFTGDKREKTENLDAENAFNDLIEISNADDLPF